MKKNNIKGFTLLELMIVVVIIAILSSIAYPAYTQYVLRTHRTQAKSVLQEIASNLERNYAAHRSFSCQGSTTRNGNHTSCSGTVIDDAWLQSKGFNTSPSFSTGNNVKYVISFAKTPTAREYELVATPQKAQINDSCGVLRLNQSNQKFAGGEDSTRGSKSVSCWE